MRDILMTDTAPFEIEVPYKLIETGGKGEKPLIIYLHGFKQNIEYFEKKAEKLLNLKACHLFIQGPYPVYDTSRQLDVSQWGRAWYLYDGNQQQFIRSMEKASVFIDNVLVKVSKKNKVSRVCIFGYSMGAYLGGYYALSRGKNIDELITIGGRIKTEAFEGKRKTVNHIHVLALHGKNDTSVYPEPQKECVEQLVQDGFKAVFKLIDAGHKLENIFIEEAFSWLSEQGYSKS